MALAQAGSGPKQLKKTIIARVSFCEQIVPDFAGTSQIERSRRKSATPELSAPDCVVRWGVPLGKATAGPKF